MIRMPVPSVLNRLNGSSRATRHLLIRARSASGPVARGGHVTSSGSQPRVCRRPARTFVLPTPPCPRWAHHNPFAEEAVDTRAPKSSCRIMESASGFTAPCSDRKRAGYLSLDAAQLAQWKRRAGCGVGAAPDTGGGPAFRSGPSGGDLPAASRERSPADGARHFKKPLLGL